MSGRWPNGVIPFTIDSSLESRKCEIYEAMAQIMFNTCIEFREIDPNEWLPVRLNISSGSGDKCSATVGWNPSWPRRLNLGDGCFHIGIIVHELMHVIGFNHMQKRHDRNEYVTVHSSNIDLNPYGFEANFGRNHPFMEQILTPWDFDSIMMYGPTNYARPGTVSISSKSGVSWKDAWQKRGLSANDVIAVRRLYECPNFSMLDSSELLPRLREWLTMLNKKCPNYDRSKIYWYRNL